MPRRSFMLAGLFAVALPAAAHAADRVLQVVAPWAVTSLEPADTGYIATRLGIAEPLTGVKPDGRIVGLVADGWTVSTDHLEWRFHVRPGRLFHDGSPVTADAVVASFERARPNAETLSTLPIATVRADGTNVVIATTSPFAPLPAFLADWGGIVLAPASYAPDGHTLAWIGTGPYKVTAIDGDRVVDLVAADGVAPDVKRVRYVAATQGETRAAMLEAGDADLAYTLLPAATARINAGHRARVDSLTIPRARLLTFDVARPMFADLATRRAISLGIDRAGIAGAILRHPASAASQLFPPGLADWHDAALPVPARDLPGARALLAQAGWRPGPDGVLTRAGEAFRFTALVPANRPELPPMAAAIQAQLRDLGIAMEVRTGAAGAIPQAHRDGSFQAAFLSRTYVNVPDPIGTIISDFTAARTTWASEGWRDAGLDALVAEYVRSFDPAAQPVLRARIAAILQAELPVVAVSWSEHGVGVSPRLRGVAIDPFEMRYLIERMSWAE